MRAVVFLLPIALGLGLVFALLFLHAVKHGQFDDLDDPPRRMLQDEELPRSPGSRAVPAPPAGLLGAREAGESEANMIRKQSLQAALLAAAGLLGMAAALHAQRPTPRPPEVTDSAVSRGREVFHGAGAVEAARELGVAMATVHILGGPAMLAAAARASGPALAQGVWLHGPDTYQAILARVVHGVPRSYSIRGVPMPMRGWNTLSDEATRAVAAYVWCISHPPRRP